MSQNGWAVHWQGAIKVAALIAVCSVALLSCARSEFVTETYVVIKPEERAKFIESITAIAKAEGLETAEKEIPEDGFVLTVLEGRSQDVTLWVQSTTLSGQEDPNLCGVHQRPYPDPAQFSVFTKPRHFEVSRHLAERLGERISSQLQKQGFDVRRRPVICGAAAT